MKQSIADIINALLSGEDVIISRLYAPITNAANCQIDTLTIGLSGFEAATNYAIGDTEYATCVVADVSITET